MPLQSGSQRFDSDVTTNVVCPLALEAREASQSYPIDVPSRRARPSTSHPHRHKYWGRHERNGSIRPTSDRYPKSISERRHHRERLRPLSLFGQHSAAQHGRNDSRGRPHRRPLRAAVQSHRQEEAQGIPGNGIMLPLYSTLAERTICTGSMANVTETDGLANSRIWRSWSGWTARGASAG